MKSLIILLALVAVACAGTPSNSFDSFDLDQYETKRSLAKIVKCMLKEGPCKPIEATLVGRVPEIVATHCKSCTDKEKEIIVVLTYRITKAKRNNLFRMLHALDPCNKISKDYLKYLNSVSDEFDLPKLPKNILDSLPDSEKK